MFGFTIRQCNNSTAADTPPAIVPPLCLLFFFPFSLLLITFGAACRQVQSIYGSVIVTNVMGGRSRQLRNVAVLTLCHAIRSEGRTRRKGASAKPVEGDRGYVSLSLRRTVVAAQQKVTLSIVRLRCRSDL